MARAACGLAAITLVAVATQAVAAAQLVSLNAARQPISLPADAAEYWMDAGNTREAAEVASDTTLTWQTLPPRGIYPLNPGQSLWLRFSISPQPEDLQWLLDIPYPALDRASLYSLDNSGIWTEQRAGDLTAVNLWPVPHSHPLLPVRASQGQPASYLLRIENAAGFSSPIRFLTVAHALREEQKLSLFLGSYFGLAILGCIVGLAGSILLRDKAYIYYGLCSATVGLLQAASTGVASLHFWPGSPQWTDRSLGVLATWMLMTLILLTTTLVSLAQRSSFLNGLVWLVVLVGGLLSIALGYTESAHRFALLAPYLLTVLTLGLLINFWAWRHGDRFGGWLLLSAMPFATCLVLALARYLQWLPQSFTTQHGVLASMALQLPAILVVLVLRSQHRRENMRRIKGLDRMDPETGLINQPVFMERLVRMIARSERLKHQSAVMLIDIVNTSHVQRDFGRRAAEELPLRVAERLLSTAREIDSAARISERRFGMLIEGPFNTEDAATLGPRVIARCLMPYNGLHVDCVAQVHLVYALVPYQGNDAQDLIARLEERLAATRADDKKAVFMLDETLQPTRRTRNRRDILPSSP